MSANVVTLFRETFPSLSVFDLLLEVGRQLRGCRTVLDLGCGASSPLQHLHLPHTVGVDGWQPALDAARANRTHTDYVLSDVTQVRSKFSAKQFDAVVALDLIEHLPEDAGLRLMKDMEWVAARKVLIFTPNGFLSQGSLHGNVLQEHLSGWSVRQMTEAGYQVLGMYGPKVLRGELQALRFRPRVFWLLVSEICQWSYVRRRPASAAALLCVNRLEPDGATRGFERSGRCVR